MSYVIRPLDPWIGPFTAPRVKSPFSATWADTLTLLEREISMLGAPHHRSWVMQIDVDDRWIRQDGELHARAAPRSPAVRVAFQSRHGPLLYAADRYTKWQDNVRGIALGLQALRAVDRYGVSGRGEQYRGWTAITQRPAVMTREQAAEFLAKWSGNGFAADAIRRDQTVRSAAYKTAARKTHPDVSGGDADTFARLTAARDLIDRAGAP